MIKTAIIHFTVSRELVYFVYCWVSAVVNISKVKAIVVQCNWQSIGDQMAWYARKLYILCKVVKTNDVPVTRRLIVFPTCKLYAYLKQLIFQT